MSGVQESHGWHDRSNMAVKNEGSHERSYIPFTSQAHYLLAGGAEFLNCVPQTLLQGGQDNRILIASIDTMGNLQPQGEHIHGRNYPDCRAVLQSLRNRTRLGRLQRLLHNGRDVRSAG